MDRVTKEAQVGELKDKLGRDRFGRPADYRGLDVPTVTGLRDEFRKVQCEYKVVKNTLVKLAIKGTTMEGIGKYLEGPTAIIFSYESPSAPAKVVTKFAKDQEKFVLKGGFFEGTVLDAKGVEGLAHDARQGRAARDAARDASWRRRQNLVRTLSAGRAELRVPPRRAKSAPARRGQQRYDRQSARATRILENEHGRREHGPDCRPALEPHGHADRRAHQEARGQVGRQGGSGRRCRPGGRGGGGGGRGCRRRRPSSPSSSPTPARTRSRSSRRSARSPASASRRPRTWSTARPRRSRKACPRTRPRTSRRSSPRPAPRSSSSKSREG